LFQFIVGVFILLHGLVHVLYAGHSRRLFELQPDMSWPEGSWLFSRFLGVDGTRMLASITYLLAALGFAAGGVGLLLGQAWWRPLVVASAAFSSVLMLLLWDGGRRKLADQGLFGLLINLAILVAVLLLQWPY
jgi:hypothetical protein